MIIKRDEYLKRLINLRDTKLIKVITGVRRCGKSTLMEMFQEYLRSMNVEEERIIAVNFEEYHFYDLRDPKKLYSYVEDKLVSYKMNYVFFDEIQHVQEFQRVVDSLYIKKNVDLYMTGSNAGLLSGELATLLSGRYVEISILPLSFREYVNSTTDKNDLSRKYKDYIEYSSFPYTMELRSKLEEIKGYLTAIYDTVVLKDICERKKISDISVLTRVTRFLLDNIGNPLSMKKIADTLTSTGQKIDVRMVERMVEGLTESFVMYNARRFDIKGKEHLMTLGKYYAVDIGLRYALLGYTNTDVGHILENVIYLELLRRGYDVYVGKLGDKEVDFVALDSTGNKYFQVAASVRDQNTLERELRPLQKINDSYPKILLTLDEDPIADYDGIVRKNALDWLLE